MTKDDALVACMVCGARMSRITVTHVRTHGFDGMAAYRSRYPDAPVVSEQQKRECSRKITASRKAMGWFSPEGRASVSEAWKQLHASGATGGENHWTHGIAIIRGQQIDVEEFRQELEGYIADDLRLHEMAERCQVDPKTITNWLSRFGLQQGIRRAERCHNWLGGPIDRRRGMSSTEYEKLRRIVIERDNHTCQQCGNTGKLFIRHVIPYRETQDNSLDNIITLCQSCHIKTELESGAWRKDDPCEK